MNVNFTQAANAYGKTSTMKPEADGLGEATASPFKINDDSEEDSGSFGNMVKASLSSAKNTAYATEGLSAAAIAGEAGLQEVAVALTNAELTLQTVTAIRDKVISAYQDISKMPI